MKRVMGWFGRQRNGGYVVCDGIVHCPSAGRDIGVDRCFACPMLDRTRVDERGDMFVSCRGAARPAPAPELVDH